MGILKAVRVVAAGIGCCQGAARAEVVGTIDTGGDVDVTVEVGSFSLEAMRDLISETNDLEVAGVLNAEGTFAWGDFSRDEGALSDKITGASRYGRDPASDFQVAASGSRFGFINGPTPEIWIPDAGLYHFGFITTPRNNGNPLTVAVTYSDATIDTLTVSEFSVTTWVGFYKPGQTITQIALSEVDRGAFANYDDVALSFVEAPSEEAPVIEVIAAGEGEFSLSFTGVLQQSSDLETWTDVDPAPTSPVVVPANGGSFFYRSRRP